MLREAAEYPNCFVPLGPEDVRIETARYVLCIGAYGATVQRQRFALAQLEDVLAEVHGHLAARGRTSTQWEVGSTAPPGLADALVARGLVWDEDPVAIALVCDTPPPDPPPGFTVRPVTTLEEMLSLVALQSRAFGATPERLDDSLRAARVEWGHEPRVTHGVWHGESLVAGGACASTAHGVALFGGATDPGFRGRGAYRALIGARWRHAVAAGAPALLTQAGSMSRPILERLGFRAVGRVEMLWDRFGE